MRQWDLYTAHPFKGDVKYYKETFDIPVRAVLVSAAWDWADYLLSKHAKPVMRRVDKLYHWAHDLRCDGECTTVQRVKTRQEHEDGVHVEYEPSKACMTLEPSLRVELNSQNFHHQKSNQHSQEISKDTFDLLHRYRPRAWGLGPDWSKYRAS